MSTVQWLLMLHVTAAFFLVGASVAAGILNVLAVRAERPSETAYLLRLIRFTLPVIGLGVAGTLVFGLWLWHELHYGLGAWWIWAALVLWVLSERARRSRRAPPGAVAGARRAAGRRR